MHDIAPEDLGPPRVGLEQRREHSNERGLAGPVRTEQPEHGPLGDLQVDPGERDVAPKRLITPST